MKCKLCKREGKLRKGAEICYGCYNEYFLIRKKCDICCEYKIIKSKRNNIKMCEKCYKAINKHQDNGKRPLRLCSKCGKTKKAAKRIENGYICHKCYIPPSKKCSICGKDRVVKKYENKQPICSECYKVPKKKCGICGELNTVKKYEDGKPVCPKCYKYPQVECYKCDRIDRAAKMKNGNPICKICYDRDRLKIETIRIMAVLRKRLRDAFRKYSSTGKTRSSCEYGIDYQAIIEHLGPCPGDIQKYQIDHIFPLVAFDFNNLTHIKAAFAPENHQWLKVEDNLSKGGKYNIAKFQKYINSHGNQ